MDAHSTGAGPDHTPAIDPDRHRSAEERFGDTRAGHAEVDSLTSERAGRLWWDADVEDYHDHHGAFLGVDTPGGDFVWCPEGMREADAGLLGPVRDKTVLELGCGSAPSARWLAGQGARVVGLDVSIAMLRRGLASMATDEHAVPLVQAGGENLPFADDSFDIVCSAFGAVPFVADSARLMREVARVLRPGGRWVFAVNHPMRWCFPDDPGPMGLVASIPYFDRTPYVEVDADDRVVYAEHHRTLGDRVRELVAAGFVLEDLIEPEWPEGQDREWGQWSPLRGRIFPGTAIFCTRLPG